MSQDEKKHGTREWSEHSVNCCLGCRHDCVYCYARTNAWRWQRITSAADWRVEKPINANEARLGRKYDLHYDGVVMFPTTHDLTIGNREICLTVLERLLRAGNQVLLVTKPSLSLVEDLVPYVRCLIQDGVLPINLAASTGGASLEVRCSITCLDDNLRQVWEPGAPPILDRIAALRTLRVSGIPTSVSIEPNLQPDRVHELVQVLAPYVSGEIWIGKLNRMSERIRWAFDPSTGLPPEDQTALGAAALRLDELQTDEAVMDVVHRLAGVPSIRWKDSYQDVIARCTK